MTDKRLTDEQIEEIRCDIAIGKCDVWPHNDTIIEALRELKAARERNELAETAVARLNSLLDWAYDGLDEYWVTLPENSEQVKLVAEMFGRKPKIKELVICSACDREYPVTERRMSWGMGVCQTCYELPLQCQACNRPTGTRSHIGNMELCATCAEELG